MRGQRVRADFNVRRESGAALWAATALAALGIVLAGWLSLR